MSRASKFDELIKMIEETIKPMCAKHGEQRHSIVRLFCDAKIIHNDWRAAQQSGVGRPNRRADTRTNKTSLYDSDK